MIPELDDQGGAGGPEEGSIGNLPNPLCRNITWKTIRRQTKQQHITHVFSVPGSRDIERTQTRSLMVSSQGATRSLRTHPIPWVRADGAGADWLMSIMASMFVKQRRQREKWV